jgi:hypothetical protein
VPDETDDLLDEILVDAYGDSEQLTAFELAFEKRARFPFPARIVGLPVEVKGGVRRRRATRLDGRLPAAG